MENKVHDRLMDAYFNALDEEDFQQLKSAFTDDIVYRYPGEGEIQPIDDVLDFFKHGKQTTNTTHDVFRRLYNDDVAIAEGHITGEIIDGGSFEGYFCNVFEFNIEAEQVSKISVYTCIE